MLLILVSIILVESVMFGIILLNQEKKNRLFIMGALIAIFLTISKLMHNNLLIWGGFIVGHIILFAMYLVYYYQLIIKTDKTDLKSLFERYIRIPTCFYVIPIAAVLCSLIMGAKDNDIVPVMLILMIAVIAGIYTFVENRTLNNLSGELLIRMEQKDLKQYIYRKNALIGVYAIIFSISAGTLYICMLDLANENIPVIIFIFEFVVNLILYATCYYKIKNKFMAEDKSQYNKWQLMVPKKVGVGYTLNFSCPLTYVILGGLFVAVIIALLL